MQSLARNGYTSDEVRAALHRPNRVFRFRYDLLDKDNQFLRTLSNVEFAEVRYNSLGQIKRTARFRLMDDGDINFLSDRIQPWVLLQMPDGDFAEFPQGVFLLSTPPRHTDGKTVTREIEAYDQLQILVDDKVESRYTVNKNVNYIAAISAVLTSAGITRQNLTSTSKTLPTARDWEPGTSKLSIIGDLLGAINYRSLYIDEHGYAVAQPYVSPAVRASEYTYADNQESVMFGEATEELDLWAIPNRWLLTVTDPDLPALTANYTNDNPDSPTSTVSRGRVIVDHREVEAADQESLTAQVLRIAQESTQQYRKIEFFTGLMPMHSDSDVYTFAYSKLGISEKFTETEWILPLDIHGRMTHRARRVESI
jgi:hypothetical protein